MTKTIIFDMHHITNNLATLTRLIDGTTEAGRHILEELAFIRSQVTATTDRLKMI